MLLEIKNLRASYENIEILHGVSMEVAEGEIVALIGSNGAGKTSLLHSLIRVAPPQGPRVTEGTILFKQQNILNLATHDLVRRLKIALVPEGRHIFGNLSVLQNLKLATYARDRTMKWEDESKVIFELFPRLKDRRDQRGELLSGGEQQMLAVARALMSGCRLLLLDEPSMGLAPVLVQELFLKLKELRERGMTIILVEQNAEMALNLADRVYLLSGGEMVFTGTPEVLRKDAALQHSYLGV